MLIFPIRHHSPAAALQLERLIRERRPKAVLIEGPADATPLIPLLLDEATAPPVALYVYRTGVEARAVFFPFCHYSPEYVALKVGQEVGALLRFCDVPAGLTLTWEKTEKAESGDEALAVGDAAAPRYADFTAALAERAGLDSFEEFWESDFEQSFSEGRQQRPLSYVEVMADFGSKARAFDSGERGDRDDVRERHMAATALAVIAEGIATAEVLLVCGAAHVDGIHASLQAGCQLPEIAAESPAAITLIPFSFPRLSEQSGYGAGNRAPWFYQQVWELGGDYAAATRQAIITLARQLRGQGQMASLAQCIDAYNLAATLAGIRGKAAPGVDEVGEAAVACFGQGQAAPVSAALNKILIGETIGRITQRVGRTSLQAEFYATAQNLGLPVLDAPRQVLVHMPVPREAAQSVFLQRLRTADVPFAKEIESGLGGRGQATRDEPLDQLSRVREKWELQWSPATDAQLIERTAWGSTLVEVCGRLLRQRLSQAGRIDAGTGVLLQMALCDLIGAFPAAMERCETLAADSASFPALAKATYHLDGLLAYGSARQLPVDQLMELAGRLFARAALNLPAAAICSDEAAAEVEGALTSLYDLVRRNSPAAGESDVFWAGVESVAKLESSHPALRGLCLVLLEMAGRMPQDELAARLRYWLSSSAEAGDNARLLAGLFSLHRGTVVRNRALIGAVTDFLSTLEVEQLTPLLPVLRRGLGNLTAGERSYLAETLAVVLGIGGGEAGRSLRISSADKERLREADATVAAVLAEWRERYGIE